MIPIRPKIYNVPKETDSILIQLRGARNLFMKANVCIAYFDCEYCGAIKMEPCYDDNGLWVRAHTERIQKYKDKINELKTRGVSPFRDIWDYVKPLEKKEFVEE